MLPVALAPQRCLGALLDHMEIYSRFAVREKLVYFGDFEG
jgi:ABC-type Na+ transport system ATPase subunit NatA